MSEVNQFQIDPYLVERQTPEELPDTLLCMDDRPTRLDILYAQTAGGADGFARDVVTGQEVHTPGSLTKLNIPMHHYSAMIASSLNYMGVDAWMHESCKAYLSAEAAVQTTVNRADEVYALSQEIDPEITFSRFDRVHAANIRLLKSGIIWKPEDSDPDLLNGIEDEIIIPGIPRLPLIDADHQAGDIVVDNGYDVVWDVRKAFEADNPAYYIGHGIFKRMVFELNEREQIGTAPFEPIFDASVVRHAALSLLLPIPEGQDRLNIHLRAAI